MPSIALSFVHKLHQEGVPTSVLGNFRADVYKDRRDCLHAKARCTLANGDVRRVSVALRNIAASEICTDCSTVWLYTSYSSEKSMHFDALNTMYSVVTQTRILRSAVEKKKVTPQFVAGKEKKLLAAQKEFARFQRVGHLRAEPHDFLQAAIAEFESLVAACSVESVDYEATVTAVIKLAANCDNINDGDQWVAVGLQDLAEVLASVRSSFSTYQVASGFGRAAAVMPRAGLYVWLASLSVPLDVRRHLLVAPVHLDDALVLSKALAQWSKPLSAWCSGEGDFNEISQAPDRYQDFVTEGPQRPVKNKPAQQAEAARKAQNLLGAF